LRPSGITATFAAHPGLRLTSVQRGFSQNRFCRLLWHSHPHRRKDTLNSALSSPFQSWDSSLS
jgi:hypothetical protein